MPLPPISVCSPAIPPSLSLSLSLSLSCSLSPRPDATRRVASHDTARRRDLTKVVAFKLPSCRRGEAFLFLDELVITLTRQVNSLRPARRQVAP